MKKNVNTNYIENVEIPLKKSSFFCLECVMIRTWDFYSIKRK